MPVELGVVIVGSSHNPSILNPDFLRHNNIVPEEWKTVAGETFSSPMASQVSYRKGEKALLVSSDISRLAFLEKGAEKSDFVCPDMARRYLKTVPHVRYTAVGINPALRASVADGIGKDILTKSLLCSGPWGDYEGVSPVLEASFAYDLGGKKISLSVGLDSTGQVDEKKGGVIFRGNIHRDIRSEKDSASIAMEIVAKWRDDLGAFCKMASSFWEKMQ